MRAIQMLCRTIFLLTLFALHASCHAAKGPTRFESTIEYYESKDQEKMPPQGAIVVTGSSSIARWGEQAHSALAPLTVIPRGFGGSTMGDLLYYLDRVALQYKPRAILIYEGGNDIALDIPEEKIISQLQEIIDKTHAALPEARIYILSVKPSISRESFWPAARQVSQRFANIANDNPMVFYVDVATPLLTDDGKFRDDIYVEDNLHLNALGNSIWGETIKAALMPLEALHEDE